MAFSKLDALASVAELLGANDAKAGCDTQKRGIRKRGEKRPANAVVGDYTALYERREKPYPHGSADERVELTPQDTHHSCPLSLSDVISAQSQHTMSVALPMPRRGAASHFSGVVAPDSAPRCISLSEPGAPAPSCAAPKRISPFLYGSPNETEAERVMPANKRRSFMSASGVVMVQPYDSKYANTGAEEDEPRPCPTQFPFEDKVKDALLPRQAPPAVRRAAGMGPAVGAPHRLRYAYAWPSPAGSGASDEPCNSSGGAVGTNIGAAGFTRNRSSVVSLPAGPLPPTPAQHPMPMDFAPAAPAPATVRLFASAPASAPPGGHPGSHHGGVGPAAGGTAGGVAGDPAACLSMMAQSPSKGGPDLLEKMKIAQELLTHRDKLGPQLVQLVVQQLACLCQSASMADLVARMAATAADAKGKALEAGVATADAEASERHASAAAGISPANSGSTAGGGGRVKQEPTAGGPTAGAAGGGARTSSAALDDGTRGCGERGGFAAHPYKTDGHRRQQQQEAAAGGSLWQEGSGADAPGSTSSSSSSRTATHSTEPHPVATGSTLSGPTQRPQAPGPARVPSARGEAGAAGRYPSGAAAACPREPLVVPRMAPASHSRGCLPPAHLPVDTRRGLCGHDSMELNNAAGKLAPGGSGQMPASAFEQVQAAEEAHLRPHLAHPGFLLPHRHHASEQQSVPSQSQRQPVEERLSVHHSRNVAHLQSAAAMPPPPAAAAAPPQQRHVEQPVEAPKQFLGLDLSVGPNATTAALIAALMQRVRPSGGVWPAGLLDALAVRAESPAVPSYRDGLLQPSLADAPHAPHHSAQPLAPAAGRRQQSCDAADPYSVGEWIAAAGGPRAAVDRYDLGGSSSGTGVQPVWRGAAMGAPKGVAGTAMRVVSTIGPPEARPQVHGVWEDVDEEMVRMRAPLVVPAQQRMPTVGSHPHSHLRGGHVRATGAPPTWGPSGMMAHHSTGGNRCSTGNSTAPYGGRQSAFLPPTDGYVVTRLSEPLTAMAAKPAPPAYGFKMPTAER